MSFPLSESDTVSALVSAITLMGWPSLPAQFQCGTSVSTGLSCHPEGLPDVELGLGETAEIHRAEEGTR